MKNIELIDFNTGELINLNTDDLKSLMAVYDSARARRDEAYTVIETIKLLLIEKSKESAVDPTRLTRRIQGDGVVAVLRENPKISWDGSLLSRAKRMLGKEQFAKYFQEKIEYKPQYRELNKLPHTIAPDKNTQKAFSLMLDARKLTGQSYFTLAWEVPKGERSFK